MLRQDDFQKSMLVLAAWRYGKEYGLTGHLPSCMIMSCIHNRVRKGWGSVLDVIDNIPKYAATEEIPTGTPAIWEPQFMRLLQEVEGVFGGTIDHANGAVYWADTRKITTPFFLNKILPDKDGHPRVAEQNSLACWR